MRLGPPPSRSKAELPMNSQFVAVHLQLGRNPVDDSCLSVKPITVTGGDFGLGQGANLIRKKAPQIVIKMIRRDF